MVHVATVSLVVLGASLAIMMASWRGTTLALVAHYLGVALLLGTSAGLARGLVSLAVGAGIVANDDDTRTKWIANAQKIKPGVNMPPHALPREDLAAISAYLGALR